jgi:hypothetical protein
MRVEQPTQVDEPRENVQEPPSLFILFFCQNMGVSYEFSLEPILGLCARLGCDWLKIQSVSITIKPITMI